MGEATPVLGDLRMDGAPYVEPSGQAMCEAIVSAFHEAGFKSWEEVWNLSPSGELWHVFDGWMAAMRKAGHTFTTWNGAAWAPYGARPPVPEEA